MSTVREMQVAVTHGAEAIGVVSAMPSGPGPIADELAAEIVRQTPVPVATWLLTSRTTADAVAEQVELVGCNHVQLVDTIDDGPALRRMLPKSLKIVQVIHVRDTSAIGEANAAAEWADAILLDSGDPTADIKQLGGTARTHDWAISRRIVDSTHLEHRKPVFLAGGLTSDNIREAIETVRPFGVDVCSGVRSNGELDSIRLERFIDAVRGKRA